MGPRKRVPIMSPIQNMQRTSVKKGGICAPKLRSSDRHEAPKLFLQTDDCLFES